jgi:hypothetical protein
LWWIVGVGLASFALSLWLTSAAQSWAFFGMPTRIWEFALGGAVFLLLSDVPVGDNGSGLIFQIAGLVALIIAVVSYDRVTPYPGIAALLPALAAVALLIGGQRAPDSMVSRALSISPLQWLGRLSYAWYLWHWPLVGLGGVLAWDIGVWGRLTWSAVALVLAWLTYHFIERPARDGRFRISQAWTAPAALGASVAAAVVAHGSMAIAFTQASSAPQRVFAAAREDRLNHDCWATTIEDVKGPCAFGDVNASTTLALLGDSHAEHWLGAFDRAGKARGWKVIAMVKGGCPVADMPELLYPRLRRYYHECTRYREAMIRRIIAMRPTAVILSSWDHYMPPDGKGSDWQVTPEMWRRGLRRTYMRLAAAGIRTIAIRGTPRTWFDVPACLSRRAARLPFASACEFDRARALSPAAVAAQDDAARGLPVRFVNMNDQICASTRCGVVRKGIIMFTDDNHLTASFSRSLAPMLGDRVASALR